MPDPKESDRERLLRLIDGSAEALKEFEKPEEASKPQPPPEPPPQRPVQIVPRKDAAPKTSLFQGRRTAQWAIIAVAVLAGLWMGADLLKRIWPAPAPAATAAVTGAVHDASGTGLRLVGVDSSIPPVALLEDLKTGKTHFARVNDRVNSVRVKQILKNKVVVTLHGRNVELQ